MGSEVVGRGATGGTTTTGTPSAPVGNPFLKNINDRLAAMGPGISAVTSLVNVTVNEAIANLTIAQKKKLAQILDKAGYTVRTPAEVDMVLATSFPNLVYRDFPDLLSQVQRNLLITEPDGGPKTSMAITQYGKEQIDSWINEGLTNKFGRTLESLDADELKVLRKAVRDYADTPSVTTVTKDAKGRSITKTKPGVTTEGVAQAVESAAMPMFADEAERRQAFEFSTILNKTLGIGAI